MQQATTAVGRLVFGSVHAKQTTDMDGKPIAELDQYYQFGVAFPKNGTQHWANLEYLAPVWNEAHAAFKNNEHASPHFSWKIQDGDSNVPNRKGTIPNTKTGFAGHWVVTFRTSLPFGLYEVLTGAVNLLGAGQIKVGDYVQVYYGVQGNNVNGPSQTNGMYLNPIHVALAGYGEAITSAPPVSAAGFGGAALPQGASTTPVGALPATGTPPAPPAAPSAPAPSAPPPPTYVPPNPGALNPPPVAPAGAAAVNGATGATSTTSTPTSPSNPPAPPAPPATPSVQFTASGAALGFTFEALLAANWTEESLRQAGYIV